MNDVASPELELQITPVKSIPSDEGVFRLVVRNSTQGTLKVDRLLTVFFHYSVVTAEGETLDPVYNELAEPAVPAELAERFVALEPGQTLEREFSLLKKERVFEALKIWEGGDERWVGSERLYQYQPRGSVRVRVSYSPGVAGSGAFYACFGVSPARQGIFLGRSGSNTLLLTVEGD